MEKKSIYVINLAISPDLNEKSPVRAFASLLNAQKYIEKLGSDIIQRNKSVEEPTAYWEDTYTYVVNADKTEYLLEITPTVLDESTEPLQIPEIEIENNTLRNENIKLKMELSKQAAMNEAALCYLVMWDGGWKYTKDHVLECMHKAKGLLENNKTGEDALTEIIESRVKYRMEKK